MHALHLNHPRILFTSLCLMAPASGQTAVQPPNYDSRTSPAPHNFNWNDHFESVRIQDDSTCKFNGGIVNSGAVLSNKASGTVRQGVFGYLQTDDQAKLTVLEAKTTYVFARGRSQIDLYNSKQIITEAQAGGVAQLRIHGGTFDRVYTWSSGGRIELDGNPVAGELTATSGGIVRQDGGQSQSLSSAFGGLAILDQGSVTDYMTTSDNSTLVIAGGTPPDENIRLFNSARVLVFHSGASFHGTVVNEKYRKLVLADLDEPGLNSNFSGLNTFLFLDGYGCKAVFSAWSEDSDLKWTGSLELIRLDEELHVEYLTESKMAVLAFRVPGTAVIQPEMSKDGGPWKPVGRPIVGDGAIHTAVSRLSGKLKPAFRLRSFNKP